MKTRSPEKQNTSMRTASLWLCVTLAFIGLIFAWGNLIRIASRNRPEAVSLEDLRNTAPHLASEASK